MHISSQEWQRPGAVAAPTLATTALPPKWSDLYRRLSSGRADDPTCAAARELIAGELQAADSEPCDLPEHPDDLIAWMQGQAQSVHAKYSLYLQERKEGAARRFFGNRAHALFALRGIAPTKLVDGAWLYGTLAQRGNPLVTDLVRTYLEELGEGQADKNHVVLYRRLLEHHALAPLDDLPDALYRQGAIQLSLGCNADHLLPEIIGFNLGYEQLPLHLLITAYELDELGIDPYYFTLHVTVDNVDTGHARRACEAVLKLMPRLPDGGEFWRRVRNGSKLAGAGTGTGDVIAQFDIEQEVLRILQRKAGAGAGAHSDYCRIAGRPVNDWLASPQDMPQFIAAMQKAGWIERDSPATESRFWNLLQGPRAEMFGVFSHYELQVIHDWLRGPASADGSSFELTSAQEGPIRQPTFRAALRLEAARRGTAGAAAPPATHDADEAALERRLPGLAAGEREDLLIELMAPAHHWSPVGMLATRVYCATAHGA